MNSFPVFRLNIYLVPFFLLGTFSAIFLSKVALKINDVDQIDDL